jgi:hypothetical protein
VVEPFEANAHGPRSLAEANQTDAFDGAVAGFGDDSEPDNNERPWFDCFGTRNTISARSDGAFGHDAIDVFRDPPPNLFNWTDPRNDFATDEREPFDCFPRIR